MADLEAQKKQVLPFLQRADEIQSVDPKVAYYCRMWAVEQALRIPKLHKDMDGLVRTVVMKLEKDKPSVNLDRETDKYHCENFATNIFVRANKIDRSGTANLETARAFYAAAGFFDVLNQFGDPDPDIIEKQRYAMWRAGEIRKAVREGRPPVPPPDASGGADGHAPGGGRAGDDLFAGPPVADAGAPDAGLYGAGAQRPPYPSPYPSPYPDLGGAAGGPPAFASTASTDSDVRDLPQAPYGAPPAPPAAAAHLGPRFKQGSRVLHALRPGAVPEDGVVGMVANPHGPDPVYKVAFRDRLVDILDSQLAPDAGNGARVVFVEAVGAPGIPGTVRAANLATWPCTYLLRLDNGKDVPASMGQLTLTIDPQQQPQQPPAQPATVSPSSPVKNLAAAAAAAVAAAVRAGAPSPTPRPPPPPSFDGPAYPSPSYPAPAGPAPPPAAMAPAPAAAPPPAAMPPAAPPSQIPVPVKGFQPPLQAIQEAQKAAKYAVSSLSFDDVAGAVKYLTESLKLLTQPK